SGQLDPRASEWRNRDLSCAGRGGRRLVIAETYRANRPLDLIQQYPLVVAWALLGGASAVLRLIVIDRMPLNEAEAGYALSAWQWLCSPYAARFGSRPTVRGGQHGRSGSRSASLSRSGAQRCSPCSPRLYPRLSCSSAPRRGPKRRDGPAS